MNDQKIIRCPICGGENIEYRVTVYQSKTYGEISDVPQTICMCCKEGFIGPEGLRKIDNAIKKLRKRAVQSPV